MDVKLVGTNVELEPLLESVGTEAGTLLSPEPIAAAYARISRSKKSVARLREDARTNVEKARRSNRNIVFEMGHASIAEHAVFNYDLQGLSRLTIEEVQRSRLASYTEKSQRYVLIGEDYHVPLEFVDGGLEEDFRAVMAQLFAGYREVHEALLGYWRQRDSSTSPSSKEQEREWDVSAKEDARYLLPLATTGQLGMTLNARSLEAMARRLKGSHLAEARKVGELLVEGAVSVAPSLVRYTDPTAADEVLSEPLIGPDILTERTVPGEVRLLHITPEAEALLAAATAAVQGRGRIEDSVMSWGGRNEPGRPLAESYYGVADRHAPAPRLFELVDLSFELTCSAACFGQLKRHRMATLLAQPYHLGIQVCVPPSVAAAGLEERFRQVATEAGAAVERFKERLGDSVAYMLTNAHCRSVIVKMNLRELYHLSRLRMDGHAQWEIRALAGQMVSLAQRELPKSGTFLCGKDRFEEVVRDWRA
jgi:flavin-dependent thymidylate synthase